MCSKALPAANFRCQALAYAEPDLLRLEVHHATHGTLELLLRVDVFSVAAGSAFTRLELVDFTVTDNDFAQLVVELMGSKLILAIVDLLVDRVDIDGDSITTKYEQGSISIDFTAALQQSKVQQKKVLDRSLFDVLHLVGLVPQPDGVLVKAKTEWEIIEGAACKRRPRYFFCLFAGFGVEYTYLTMYMYM